MSRVSRAGVRGSKEMVAIVVIASGKVSWVVGRRQGVVPDRVLGEMVSVIA